MYANLRSVCKNYADLGIRRFLLACALEDRTQLELCRQAVPATHAIVCRLTASVEAMQQCVSTRESGMLCQQFIARVAKLNPVLDRARLEDFTVANDNRSLTEVALEVLAKAGWISN